MVEKNKEYVAEVLDLTHDGLGVTKVESGFAVFVEGALPGEQIRMKVVKVTQNFA